MIRIKWTLLCFLLSACTEPLIEQQPEQYNPNSLSFSDNFIPVNFITTAEHIELIDYTGSPHDSNNELMVTLQFSMIKMLWKSNLEKIDLNDKQQLYHAMKFLSKENITLADKALLQRDVITRLSKYSPNN